MRSRGANPVGLERLLAAVLDGGTWLACAVIAAGLALALLEGRAELAPLPSGMPIVTAGIAIFILLPVLRVTLMLGTFVRQRDYRFGGIAALVLLIIAAGFAIGALPA